MTRNVTVILDGRALTASIELASGQPRVSHHASSGKPVKTISVPISDKSDSSISVSTGSSSLSSNHTPFVACTERAA
jgi:hypothetical protein